ncbi:MAG: hypothetical protein ABGX22_15985 [Pirellulaceae bacterium]
MNSHPVAFTFCRQIPWCRLALLWSLASLFTLAGCGKRENAGQSISPPHRASSTSRPGDSGSTIAAGLSAKIKFKTENGDTAFSLKPQDDGAKLVDADERELARFNLSGSKLKVKDANDLVLGYIVASAGKYKIKNASQGVELWKLQRQDDGDWKLEDEKDQLIYKIKKREYGFEIEDATETSLFKVKLKDGKSSLRDTSDHTVFSTKDQVPTIAVSCLGFETIESLPLRSALMTMLIIDAGR